MKKETQIPEHENTEEKDISFGNQMYDALAPRIKQFLVDYYGERFFELESGTYRKIEQFIRDELGQYADAVTDILFRYRTITDRDVWSEAMSNFRNTGLQVDWPKNRLWQKRRYKKEKDEDEVWREMMGTESDEEKMARKIVDVINDLLNPDEEVANFLKKGCPVFIGGMQSFIEDSSSFQLSVLSPEGLESLQIFIEMMAETLFERLNTIMSESKN